MRARIVLVLVTLGFLAGCRSLELPQGDPERGRVVFAEKGCNACHRVMGESFAEPVADPPVPVMLGNPSNRKSRRYIAESIIYPSHEMARPQPRATGDPAMVVDRPVYANIQSGGLSRMGSYNDYLTVREWLDLVAYLEAMQNRNPLMVQRAAK